MIVLNHCGVSNAVYYTSHFSHPYAFPPSPEEGSVSIDYNPGPMDLDNISKATEAFVDQTTNAHTPGKLDKPLTKLDTISHIVIIKDKDYRTFSLLLDRNSEYCNWIFVYLPTGIYEDT